MFFGRKQKNKRRSLKGKKTSGDHFGVRREREEEENQLSRGVG